MSIRILYIIRHGQYDIAAQVPDGGSLTELGRMQAQHAAKALAHIPIDAIHASTMTRALETADIIAQEVQHDYLTHDLLREAIPTIPPRLAAEILAFMAQDPTFTHETINANKKRVEQAFEIFFTAPDEDAEATYELLVCHGNILRYFVCKALDINVDTWAKININHCGITSISIDSQGRMRLLTHNETRHIPLNLLTN
jgi:serine/threonine-protein phosphatase PGAM5